MKSIKLFLCALSVLITASFGGITVQAEPASSFSIEAIIPENQVDKQKTYFDLRLEPGQKQKIQLKIYNGGDKDIVANVALNSATTGRNALILYNAQGVQDESLKYSIENMAKVVTDNPVIPASGSKIVDIEIEMPNEKIDGVILGGLYVTADVNEADTEPTDENIQIKNQYAYVVALQLSQNDTKVDTELHLKSIEPALVNYKTSLLVNIQNSEPIVMKEIVYSAEVYKKGSDKVLRHASMEHAEFAPNSNFDFKIDWDNQKIEPGVYRLKMKATHEGKVWDWDEEFTISDTDDINNNAVDLRSSIPIWLMVVLGIIILGIVFYFAFVLGKRSRDDKEKE